MKQTLIDSMSSNFMIRCEYFINENDIANANALYSEFVVDGVDPEDGEYEWFFMESLCC
jgi:hypothetical protein